VPICLPWKQGYFKILEKIAMHVSVRVMIFLLQLDATMLRLLSAIAIAYESAEYGIGKKRNTRE
jgi:hypothetical protein